MRLFLLLICSVLCMLLTGCANLKNKNFIMWLPSLFGMDTSAAANPSTGTITPNVKFGKIVGGGAADVSVMSDGAEVVYFNKSANIWSDRDDVQIVIVRGGKGKANTKNTKDPTETPDKSVKFKTTGIPMIDFYLLQIHTGQSMCTGTVGSDSDATIDIIKTNSDGTAKHIKITPGGSGTINADNECTVTGNATVLTK